MSEGNGQDSTSLTQLTRTESEDLVEVADNRYALARLATFGLRRQARCRAIWSRMAELEKVAEPSEQDEREYRAVARELAAYALPTAPADVLDGLDDEQLGDLAVLFFGQGAIRSRRLEVMRSLSSELSWLGSNGSTAETPSAGSTSP